MSKNKLYFLIDECISSSGLTSAHGHANYSTFEEMGLPRGIDDEDVLAAGHRKERLVLTYDTFSIDLVRQPNFRNTGVITVPDDSFSPDIEDIIRRLAIKFPQESLTRKATTATRERVLIRTGPRDSDVTEWEFGT